MNDLWGECFDGKMGMPPKTFEKTFCRVCMNTKCSRSAGSGTRWTRRITTQVDRLLTNPNIADPDDPQFADIRSVDFPSALREAMRLEISDRRGDWSVPSETDAAALAREMAGRAQPQTPAPQAPPPLPEKVLQRHSIRGTMGDDYLVTLVEREGSAPRWVCTCKAYEFGGGKPCKHIAYAVMLPAEDDPEEPLTTLGGDRFAPDPPKAAPARFQAADLPKPATPPPAPPKAAPAAPADPRRPFLPPMGNIPTPSGGLMVDGSAPPPPKSRTAPAAPAPVNDPWAVPAPKPKVIPVGGRVVMGSGNSGEKK